VRVADAFLLGEFGAEEDGLAVIDVSKGVAVFADGEVGSLRLVFEVDKEVGAKALLRRSLEPVRLRELVDELDTSGAGWRWRAAVGGLPVDGSLEDGEEGGFGLAPAIPEKRVVGAAARGKVVELGVAVVDAPEGDAAHLVGVLEEDLKELGVALGQTLLHLFRQAVFVRVGAGVALGSGGDIGRVEEAGAGRTSISSSKILTRTPSAAKSSMVRASTAGVGRSTFI